MPRVTRTALRTAAILEDEAHLAAATPLPTTPTISRTPLGEVAGNVYGEVANGEEQEPAIKPAKKVAAKGRKAKGTKEGRKKNDVGKENEVEILEDPYQSSASSAVEEACEELLKGNSGGMHQLPMHDSRPRTPPSKAVQAALKQLSPKAYTPRFDPEVHKTAILPHTPGTSVEDSFINTIGARAPAPITHSQTLSGEILDKPTIEDVTVNKDDSFIEDIVTRSPVRVNMRIEDTVEAIDAFEEAIEQITEAIPIVVEDRLSPVKVHHVEKKVQEPIVGNHETSVNLLTTKKSAAASSRVKRAAAAKKPTSETQRKAPIKRSPLKANSTTRATSTLRTTTAKLSTANNASVTPKSTKPTINTTTATLTANPAVNTNTVRNKHARGSSISKAPFVPQRSTKAPTRPTFTLPGDAISQKLKAQREERLKREEEETTKKREFKARPVRVSLAPVVKGTAASRARMSLARGEVPGDSVPIGSRKDAPVAKLAKSTPRISATSSPVANTNGQRINTARRASVLPCGTSQVRANTSAPRAPSLAGPPHATVTSKGKEVFGRVLAEQEARDEARKVKEEAAMKARAEAAERGRIASREWAEKMKARKAKQRSSLAVAV